MLQARERWLKTARWKQQTPTGDWDTWLLMGGRGAGKTRTGAEDMAWFAGGRPNQRLAIIAATAADARDTCVEGHSGLLSVIPPECVTNWNRSLGELDLWNGSHFKLFSAEEPERLRGPQHHRIWGDELGAWRYAEQTWDQAQFGLRLGEHPRFIITTTPRPTALIKKLMNDPRTHVTRESTYDNESNLPKVILNKFRERYEGTRLGRQELDAEILSDVAGALWRRAQIDELRVKEAPELRRVVVAIDPAIAAPTSEEDADQGLAETGIVVAGLGTDDHVYVLDDYSGRMLPEAWAKRAVSGYDLYDGDAIVAETNQGGEMVKATIRAVRPTIKVIGVHASKGKVTRAEPVSALYEQGRVHHVGGFPELEDQQVAFTTTGIVGGTTGDRVDALVWAITELFPRATRKTTTNVANIQVENVSGYQPHGF